LRIKRYHKKYTEAVELLIEKGILEGPPTQKERVDLLYDDGVDITLRLRRMTPSRFRRLSDLLLMAAFQEAERYPDQKYRFAKFEVRLNVTAKGRKTGVSPARFYTAAKHTDSDIMVYGEEALGYELPDEYKKRPFLTNKVDEILDIPDSPSPGPYVQKQNPYRVLTLTVCIRAGFNELTMADVKRMKEEAEAAKKEEK